MGITFVDTEYSKAYLKHLFTVNELLGKPFSKKELVQFAMKGEAIASGSEHADNVAPAIFGGITLIRSTKPLDVIKIESPSELYATVIHPQIELKTSDMRAVLKPEVSLKSAIIQWGNLGGLISGFYTSDYELIGRSLHDEIVEPLRGQFIPKFDLIKRMALENGALGSGTSAPASSQACTTGFSSSVVNGTPRSEVSFLLDLKLNLGALNTGLKRQIK